MGCCKRSKPGCAGKCDVPYLALLGGEGAAAPMRTQFPNSPPLFLVWLRLARRGSLRGLWPLLHAGLALDAARPRLGRGQLRGLALLPGGRRRLLLRRRAAGLWRGGLLPAG